MDAPETSNTVTSISRLTAGLVTILATLAFILSYSSLQHMAFTHGLPDWRSYVWPVLLDGAMIIFSLAILRGSLRGEFTVYPWILALVFAGLATAGNVLDVTTLGLQQVWISAAVKILPPVALVLAFELLMGMVKAEIKRYQVVNSLATLQQRESEHQNALIQLEKQMESTTDKLTTARAELNQLRAELRSEQRATDATTTEIGTANLKQVNARRRNKKEQRQADLKHLVGTLGDAATVSALADELGCSRGTVRNDLADLGIVLPSQQSGEPDGLPALETIMMPINGNGKGTVNNE